MLGYAIHPAIVAAVLLEHGCEKTHNDYMTKELRSMVRSCVVAVGLVCCTYHAHTHTHTLSLSLTAHAQGVNPGRFSYASTQLDGGIEACYHKVCTCEGTTTAHHAFFCSSARFEWMFMQNNA